MAPLIESLESRRLLSVTIPTPSGTYTGTFIPTGRAAHKAFAKLAGTTAKHHHHSPYTATLTLTIANNATTTGTLNIPNIGNYTISGTVLVQRIDLTLLNGGNAIGTVGGYLTPRFKNAHSTLTETLNGRIYHAKLNLKHNKT